LLCKYRAKREIKPITLDMHQNDTLQEAADALEVYHKDTLNQRFMALFIAG